MHVFNTRDILMNALVIGVHGVQLRLHLNSSEHLLLVALLNGLRARLRVEALELALAETAVLAIQRIAPLGSLAQTLCLEPLFFQGLRRRRAGRTLRCVSQWYSQARPMTPQLVTLPQDPAWAMHAPAADQRYAPRPP